MTQFLKHSNVMMKISSNWVKMRAGRKALLSRWQINLLFLPTNFLKHSISGISAVSAVVGGQWWQRDFGEIPSDSEMKEAPLHKGPMWLWANCWIVVLALKTAIQERPADELHFRTMTKRTNANFQHHTFYESASNASNCDQCTSHEWSSHNDPMPKMLKLSH